MSHPFADESLPELILGLKSPNPAARARSARGLAKMGPTGKEVFQALYALTDDAEQTVREAAVQGLGAFGPHAVPVMIRLLGHSCKYVRRNAVWTLGKLGPDALPAVRPLCNALKDPDPRTAGGAAQALGAVGRDAADAVAPLAEAMRGTNVVLCRLAGKALSQIGQAALPTLVQHLTHHDPFVRGEAAVALGWMGAAAAGAVSALCGLLARRSPPPRPSMLKGGFGGSGAVTPMAIAPADANTTEEGTLLQVVQALGRIGAGATAAEPHLLDLLTDHRETVRDAAADALKRIREE